VTYTLRNIKMQGGKDAENETNFKGLLISEETLKGIQRKYKQGYVNIC